MSQNKKINHESISDSEAARLDADSQYVAFLDKEYLTQLEEREEFFRIFDLTQTYPM